MPAGKKDVQKEILALRARIRHHDEKYYRENSPEISDREYARLMDRLRTLETRYPKYADPNSPTQRVSGAPRKEFATVEHMAPMLSMDNTYSQDELRDFDKRLKKNLSIETLDYLVELKFDGVSIDLIYEKGMFIRAATRGDGSKGDDVSANIKAIGCVPLRLKALRDAPMPKTIEVRGEVYMTKKGFAALNEQKKKEGEVLFANPRNAAAGSLKLLDPREVARRHLNIFIYGVGYTRGFACQTQEEVLRALEGLGFNVNPHYRRCRGIDAVIAYCDEWDKKRSTLAYATDGMVIKANSLEYQKKLGATSKSPRWMVAYKFPAERATTLLEDIRVQVGRTGALTPVAVLKPVFLSGTTVSRASLHNEDEIQRNDIRIHDTVIIEKAGEIIPQVVDVVRAKRTGKEKVFAMPTRCPVCHGPVKKSGDEVALRCVNKFCPAQVKESFLHFASRQAMDIENVGEAFVSQIIEQKLVSDFADLYDLSVAQLSVLERMGEKSARNIVEGIAQSKTRPLSRLIYALGIRHVGVHVAKVLARHYGDIEALMQASRRDLESIKELGPVIAESVHEFFSSTHNKKVIAKLRSKGLVLKEDARAHEGPLSGKSFVFTGELKSFTRLQAQELVENFGGTNTSQVSKKTNFVVCGENPGSKYDDAKKYGVAIIGEDEFKKMVGYT